MLPAKVKPEQAAAWWIDPGSCDIEDIDVAGKPKRNILGLGSKAQKRAQARIPVTATKTEEAQIRRNLIKVFTNEELTTLGRARAKIHVYPRTHKAAGTYESARNRITVDRDNAFAQTTVTHEAVHALRDKDKSRHGILKRSKIPGIEESLTVAEHRPRSSPAWSPAATCGTWTASSRARSGPTRTAPSRCHTCPPACTRWRSSRHR